MKHGSWKRHAPRVVAALGALLCGALGWMAHAARGGTGPETLYFNGTLRDAVGPLGGTHSLVFTFRKATATCAAPAVDVTLAAGTGSFSAPVSLAGCAAFFDGSDVTYDISVDGALAVSNQPMGAVPYAKYADVAVHRAPGDETTLASRTRASITLFVRVDGNDATCSGRSNAAAALTDACAVATLQRAVDLLPETGQHQATIRLGAGTFYKTAATDLAVITRPYPVLIYGQGTGATVLSGASAMAPDVPLGGDGIVFSGGAGGRVQSLTITRTAGAGIAALRAVRLDLNAVVSSFSHTGVMCDASLCVLAGDIQTTDNTYVGLNIHGGTGYLSSATFTAARNAHGVLLEQAADVSAGSSTITLDSNIGYGLWCASAAQCLMGPITATNNGSWAILGTLGSRLYLAGNLSLTGRFGMAGTANARLEFPSGNNPAIRVDGLDIAGSVALSLSQHSTAYFVGGSVFTLNFVNVATPVAVDTNSALDTGGTNPASVINSGSVSVSNGSFYRRAGGWPVAVSCLNSQCM